MLTALLSILTNRILWSFLGAMILAAVIWMIGPQLAIVDTRPLESERNRIISIVVVFLIWIQSYILSRLYNTWQNRRLMDKLNKKANSSESVDPQGQLNREVQSLAECFDEATQILKKAHFSKIGSRAQWTQRFSTQYLYRLPWYVIIGTPGSGKSTALANSGLQFPLTNRFSEMVFKRNGGTRNCDWWLTNDAVLLDTAGRYTTQENEPIQDASEWLEFISLLRKYRRRQPINGVIITISISDLLTQSTDVSRQQAVSLRLRLSELHEQLGIRFPVYVMMTKADLLKGFRAWFSEYDKVQRDQIWGFTLPWEQTLHADYDLISNFSREFTLLQRRLDVGLPKTMLRENDAKIRAEAYLFPQEFAALHPVLADYLNMVFARSNFETQFSPRGIYFTSGTQGGMPLDRVMAELNRTLSLPETEEGTNQNSSSKEVQFLGVKGQSFFIKDLLQNVIFKEAGIAGENRWWEMLNRAGIWSGYATLLALLVILGGLWISSYNGNKAYLEEISAKIPLLEQQSKALQDQSQRDLFALLPLLNGLVNLPKSDTFDVSAPPISRRMGFYRGDDVSDVSQSLYQKALEQKLLPAVAKRITTWLRNDNGSDVEYSYETLKAYQMLYQPEHYDGKFLHSWMILDLQRYLPQNVTQTQLQQLEWHLAQLLESQIKSSPYAQDKGLIARERALINKQPLSTRIYGRLKRLLNHDDALKPVSLADLGGPWSEQVFSRKSGKPVSDGVPGIFTPDGYWKDFNRQIESVTTALYEDDTWVLGTTTLKENKQQIDNAVRQLYMRDFIAHWDRFIADIQLNNSADLSQRINTTRLLSGANSPLRRLVQNLSKNLTLARNTPIPENTGKMETQTNSASRTLQMLFSSNDSVAVKRTMMTQVPEQLVTDHYAQMVELAQPLEKGSKTIVFDDFLKQIDELYRYLIAVQDAANSGMPAPGSEVISRLQASAGRLPSGLQTMFRNIAVGASSDTQRRDLENVRKRINVEVGGFCRQAIAKRYPLVRSASSEVTLGDIARMFAPGSGLMDSFFRDNLANKVDTTQANWRFMPGIDGKTLPGSEGLLRPFQQGQSIRDAFFANGATTPSFKVTVRTVRMDNTILSLTLDVDGQILRYSHGPQAVQVIDWPGPGGTNQVRMQLGLTNGSTATLVTNGSWALNRFFDKASISAGAGSLNRQATFIIEGHKVTLEFTPNSIRNPFQLPRFSCP